MQKSEQSSFLFVCLWANEYEFKTQSLSYHGFNHNKAKMLVTPCKMKLKNCLCFPCQDSKTYQNK